MNARPSQEARFIYEVEDKSDFFTAKLTDTTACLIYCRIPKNKQRQNKVLDVEEGAWLYEATREAQLL